MKPTNNNEEIFPCTKCGNHAQPTPQPSDRKKVIYRDNCQDEDYHLYLTDDQIDLLEWMVGREYILDGNYEIVEDVEFITI